MIDKASFIYSKDVIRQKFESFSNINLEAKALAEKNLGCVFRSRMLNSGDAILFCLPNRDLDQGAVDKGIKFLKEWERRDFLERNAGRLLDFVQVSKDFNDPACVVDSGMCH